MAWTAPADFNTGEVVTAAKLNTHVRDNLRYLKGLDGAIALDAALSVTGSVQSSGTFNGTGTAPGLWLAETSAKGAYLVLNSGLLQLQRRATNFGAFEANPIQWNINAPSSSFVMDASGNVLVTIDHPH